MESALFALAFAVVFDGARRLVAGGVSRWTALALAVALLVPFYEGYASLRLSTQLRVLSHAWASMGVAEPAGGWEQAPLSAEERTQKSTRAAELNFRVSGKHGQFIDASGKRVAFQPRDEDQSDRDSLVHDQKGTEDAAGQFFDRGVRLLASAASFLLLGLLAGAFQRRRR